MDREDWGRTSQHKADEKAWLKLPAVRDRNRSLKRKDMPVSRTWVLARNS